MFNNKYRRYLKKNIYFISNSLTQFNYFKSLDIDDEFNIIFIDKLGDLLDFLELDENITSAEDKTYIFSYLDLPIEIDGVINELADYFEDLPSLVIEFFDDSYIDNQLIGNLKKSVKVLSIMDFEQDISEESFIKLNEDRNKAINQKNKYDDYLTLDNDDSQTKSDNDRLSILNKNKNKNKDINIKNTETIIEKEEELELPIKDIIDENYFNDEEDDFEVDENYFNDDEDDFEVDENYFNDIEEDVDIEEDLDINLNSNKNATSTTNNSSSLNLKKDSEINIDIVKLEELNKSLIKEYEAEKFKSEKELRKFSDLTKDLKFEIDSLKKENKSLLDNLKILEVELRTKVNFDLVNDSADKDIILEINAKENLILSLEKEIKVLKHKNSTLETQISGTKSLNKEQYLEIKRLNIEIESLNNKINEIRNKHSEILKDYVLLSEYDKAVEENKSAELKIFDLEGQIRILKTDISKNEEQKELLKEEFSNLENLYKAVLTSESDVKNNEFNELSLSDDVMTSVLYFKMLSRPSYFGSFLNSLKSLISKNGRVLTLIIQEENYQTSLYYPNVPILSEFNLIKNYSDEDTIILKPSKYMLGDDEDLFSVFDTVIVLDYSNTKKILIKGINVFSIYTCINEKECDLLGLRGTKLCNIGNSVVDLRYDNKFEFAKTAFARKAAVDKKVKVWLNNIGIKVK